MISGSHGSAQEMCNRKTTRLDRLQPTVIGSPPASFGWREMASVPYPASVPSAEREHGIKKRSSAKAQERAEPEVRIHLPPADSPALSANSVPRLRTPAFRASVRAMGG